MLLGITADVLLGRLLVIFLGIPIHEWAHGWVAHLLGDETPEMQGRLSLNPFVHLDPIGTLAILLTGFGWGRAARVNPYRMHRVRNPRLGMALSALAGPVSNIVQAMVLVIPIRLGLLGALGSSQGLRLAQVLFAAIQVNIGLAAFNLLPIPPLDGSRVLAGVAPPRVGDFHRKHGALCDLHPDRSALHTAAVRGESGRAVGVPSSTVPVSHHSVVRGWP